MKKIALLFLTLFVIFYNIDSSATNLKSIDLNDGINIVFLKLPHSTSLLITEEESYLFVLEYKDMSEIKDALEIFDVNPSIYFIDKSFKKKVDDIYVDSLKFMVDNRLICITNKSISCDFIYLESLDKDYEVNSNIEAIFYDEGINKDYLTKVNESWVTSTIVSTESFTILKLYEEDYDILVVPLAN